MEDGNRLNITNSTMHATATAAAVNNENTAPPLPLPVDSIMSSTSSSSASVACSPSMMSMVLMPHPPPHYGAATNATTAPSTTMTPSFPSVMTFDAPPLPQTEFESWEAFEQILQQYQRQTFQRYVNRSTTSVKSRNASIEKKRYKNPTDFLPESYGVYRKTMICTHGYGERRSRGNGQRARRKPRDTACKAKLVVCLRKKYGNSSETDATVKYLVMLQMHDRVHNHPLSAELYASYPENRRIDDPQVIEAVREMLRAGAKRRHIWKYLKETSGKALSMKDMHNLAAKLKTPGSNMMMNPSDVDVRVLQLLENVKSDSEFDEPDDGDEDTDKPKPLISEVSSTAESQNNDTLEPAVIPEATPHQTAPTMDNNAAASAQNTTNASNTTPTLDAPVETEVPTDSVVGLEPVALHKRKRVMEICDRIAQMVAQDKQQAPAVSEKQTYTKFMDFLTNVESICASGKLPVLANETTTITTTIVTTAAVNVNDSNTSSTSHEPSVASPKVGDKRPVALL